MRINKLKGLMEKRIAEGWNVFPTFMYFMFHNPKDGFVDWIGYPGEEVLVYELRKGKVIFK